MNRALMAIAAALVLQSACDAQGTVDFEPYQVITSNVAHATSVYASDLDADGDLDALSSSWGDDMIAWYHNTDGLGTFGAAQPISIVADSAWCVYAADLDGDGDSDVLSASQLDNKIAWYPNDGLGGFGATQIITSSAVVACSVTSADVDGDGDVDVLSASAGDNIVSWYENVGFGAFGAPSVITASADGAWDVFADDLDGDGDIDVLAISQDDDTVAWYENTDGAGQFSSASVISANARRGRSVLSADIDGDGDSDVVSASFEDDKIAWYENSDGAGGFGPETVITSDADAAFSVDVAYMDGDGDMDVLSASDYDDMVAWFENEDGLGGFGSEQALPTVGVGASCVFAGDLDGDGDEDVLSCFLGGIVGWSESAIVPRPPPVWADLDRGLAGLSGVPQLVGFGSLLPGTSVSIALSQSSPFALATLVVGFTQVDLPFKGGVLVSDLGFLFVQTTDFFGESSFAGLWPAGVPSGFTTYFQYWITDAAGPQGFAASNGLSGTTP